VIKLAYSTLACPNWTVEQAVEAAKLYGYDAIEWRLADGEVLSPQTPESVKRRVVEVTQQHGLAVACLDTSCQFVQASDEARRQVIQAAIAMTDLAVELGAPYLRVFGGKIPEGSTRAELLAPTRAALATVAAYCATKAVTLLLETHDDWSRSLDSLALITGIPAGAAILWDVHHPFRMDETPAQTLHNLKDGQSVAHVHIKDARRDSLQASGWQLTLLGEGEVPVQEAVQLLQQHGYNGYLSLEWEKKWHPEIAEPEVALPQAMALLRAYLATAQF
jgi:sugar phosphate isomerase/epimerase